MSTVAFSIVKVAAGLFLIGGQFAFEERGTFYGFVWPHSLNDFFADWRTVALLMAGSWLIYSGIWGIKPTKQ